MSGLGHLLLTLAILHGADAAATAIALEHGAVETNPFLSSDLKRNLTVQAIVAPAELLLLHQLGKEHPTAAKRTAWILIGFKATAVGQNLYVTVKW